MAIECTNFINSSDYTIFPSSNAIGNGKITTEKNIQNIVGRLGINGFKSSEEDFTLSYSNGTLSITSGKGNIVGYWFELTETTTVPLTLPSDGTYEILLGLVYDNNGLLAADESGKSVCIKLIAEESETINTRDYLYLGDVIKTGSSYDVTTQERFIYAISTDIIQGPDNKSLTEDLLDIPDLYVSKVNDDTKEGSLTFLSRDSEYDTIISDGSISMYSETLDSNSTWIGNRITLKTSDVNPTILVDPGFIIGISLSSTNITFDTTSISLSGIVNLPQIVNFGTGSASSSNAIQINTSSAPVISTSADTLQANVKSGNGTFLVNGDLRVTKDIRANRVYNAVFNGFGEIFRKDKNEVIEYGDLVCVGSDGLIHKYNGSVYSIRTVIGVCSDTIGFMLGGENIPEDERVEVELLGQIWIKTKETNITPGQMLAIDDDGTVKLTDCIFEKFGIALTSVVDGKVRVLYNGH